MEFSFRNDADNKQYLVKPDIGHKNLVFLILKWKLSRFMKKNRIILSDKKYVYMYLRKKYCFCFHYKVV